MHIYRISSLSKFRLVQASLSLLAVYTTGVKHIAPNGVARIFVWGGPPGTFSVISPGADRIQWGGVVAEIFRDLNYRVEFSGGGGVVAEIFPVNKSITFHRFRDILGTFWGHLRITRRLWKTHENSGTLPRSAYTFKPRNNINSVRKKTFTKSLGGGMAPLAPWLRH